MNYYPGNPEDDYRETVSDSIRKRSNQPPTRENADSIHSPGPRDSNSELIRCAYCGGQFDKCLSKHMPFCSKRCQEIDLGMWLNESYGFPHEGESASEFDNPADEEF